MICNKTDDAEAQNHVKHLHCKGRETKVWRHKWRQVSVEMLLRYETKQDQTLVMKVNIVLKQRTEEMMISNGYAHYSTTKCCGNSRENPHNMVF